MENSFLIRAYRSSDVRELAKLFYDTVHTVNRRDYSDEQLNAWATGRVDLETWDASFLEHTTLVALCGDQIVGFGDISADGYLDRLYVHREYQGQGIASALCSRLELCADGTIETHASITAKPFFEHRGYQVIRPQQVQRNDVLLTNFVMKKPNRKIMETDRLIFRELWPYDVSDLSEMIQNPAVMYAYEHDFSDEDVQNWLLRQRRRYQQDGFGLWALVLKSTGEMVGQAGLTMQPYRDRQVLEIGYLLKQNAWHHGYAREAAEACKRYAFEVLHASNVYSIIKVDNQASIRVAQSIGMTKEEEFEATYYHGPMLHALYSVCKSPFV